MLRTVAKYAGFAFSTLSQTGARQAASDLVEEIAFDLRRGIDTITPRELHSLGITSPGLKDGVQYQPANLRLTRELLSRLPDESRRGRFIDYGCGKGRAMLLAAEARYTRLTGVEFAPALAEVARRNLESVLAGTPTKREVLTMDAASYVIPVGPVTLFFYNPFSGETLANVLDQIRRRIAEGPHDVWVAYLNPKWLDRFHEAGLITSHEVRQKGRMAGAVLVPNRLGTIPMKAVSAHCV